ncbi:MAG: hypothetical protein U0074_12280 [Kouleothrix sp.]
MAVRLKYAGIDPAQIRSEPDLPRALDAALAQLPPGWRCMPCRPTPQCLSCGPKAAQRQVKLWGGLAELFALRLRL